MLTRADIEKMVNHLYRQTGADRFFEEPDIRIAAADDPFFLKFKEIIGPFHWTPDEVLKRKFPDAQAKSVIVWVLPVNRKARETNAAEKVHPSVEWAAVRSFGEILNEEMRAQLAGLLTREGFPAVAPHLEQKEVYPAPGWDVKNFTSVRAARRLRGRGRHLRAVGQPDHRTRHGHAARFGRDRTRAAGGQASLRRRPVRLVHPLRRLHPALPGPCGRREILGPRQAGLREIRRHRNLPRTRTHLRLARAGARLRPLPDRRAV